MERAVAKTSDRVSSVLVWELLQDVPAAYCLAACIFCFYYFRRQTKFIALPLDLCLLISPDFYACRIKHFRRGSSRVTLLQCLFLFLLGDELKNYF
jgi:hypothetical protein